MITNPILPGFNPDPSILRVGEDYYIANSTFEWFPGVQIHHSRDLVNWRLLTRPLDRTSQLDMAGNPDSGGIWAPCLTWAGGLFWLVYTNVRSLSGAVKDTHNYLVTAPSITGPWSEPVYLNSSGFDPSLFHDDDGRKWIVNMLWDPRAGIHPFAGIVLQQYDHARGGLVGPITNIFRGTELKVTEGPHLYKRDGRYYLLTAEGGTGSDHAVSIARSDALTGPYRIHPDNPLVTSRERPELELWKAGHGDLVETPAGECYLVHLCGRPLGEHRRCILGRETAIQKVEWGEDDWPRLATGGNAPAVEVPAPDLPAHPWPAEPEIDDFRGPELGIHWQSLRVPVDRSWLEVGGGRLRLYGRESLRSCFRQSLIARRIEHFRFTAETELNFAPEDFQQAAGLVAWYDTENWYYLRLAADAEGARDLRVLICDDGAHRETPTSGVLPPDAALRLQVRMDHQRLRFAWTVADEEWREIGDELDATLLSDEYGNGTGCFTGAFVGLCCQDLSGRRLPADFAWFRYAAAQG